MLRIDDDGRAPRIGPLTDIIAHPLGFAWHPSTAALWLIFPGVNGETLVRPSGVSSAVGIAGVERGVLRLTEGAAPSSGALVLNQAGALDLAHTFLQGIDPESIGVLRLVMPVLAESVLDGVPGRITDVVPAGAGTLYVTTDDGEREPPTEATPSCGSHRGFGDVARQAYGVGSAGIFSFGSRGSWSSRIARWYTAAAITIALCRASSSMMRS